ncbi:unnamed protein product [Callosobruchus maculatus]|uniref:Uncharacterized protein n=1 Tax=Callosobruchus maculatus TaxID=64391 RepID=A0A653D9V5_CALMS|nr:unnamed protein product [Callosobruchus maculatus]
MSRSEYYSSLSGDIKLRCDEKMKLTDGVDPYALRIDELSEDVSFLPAVKIVDLMNYLVLTHCFYTGQQMKAYKSLQAFEYYEAVCPTNDGKNDEHKLLCCHGQGYALTKKK